MKKVSDALLIIFLILAYSSSNAQDKSDNKNVIWNHNLEIYNYFMKDDFIFDPIYCADKGWLHLEARYNYEDINTFSAWFGYNFIGGNTFQYTITPIVGAIVGNINGIAPGLKFDFLFHGFEFNFESEYIFDLEHYEKDYYYNWTDFTFAPLEWFWFGTSFQRTQLFQAETENQFGLILGASFRCFEIEPYFYNPWTDNPYFILAISINLPEN